MSDSPLALSREEMRRTGYAVVDRLVEWIEQPDPVITTAGPAEMERRIPAAEPAGPVGVDEVLARLERDVFAHASRAAHPGYLAYVPGSTTWPAALAEFMAAVANPYCGSWLEAAGPSRLELVVTGWFASWLGLPAGTEGVLTSGGSAANLMALAVAREERIGRMRPDAMIYCSDQAHSSIGRAARTLGFGSDQVHVVPADGEFRLRVGALAASIAADRGAGRLPLLVAASAGSTNTGAVDPLADLADLCAEQGVWLHVDAAYGGFAALTDRGRAALRGIERADSVTLDPHKWLFQPMECGALLVREPGALERSFTVLPDYLADSQAHDAEVNFSDRGLQLTRNARSVKVWASLATFGTDAFRVAVDRGLDLARVAQELIEADDDLELLSPARLGIVCFRRRVDGAGERESARVNAWLIAELAATGRAMISSTRLHGRFALRLCVLNHLTERQHVEWTLDFLARTAFPAELGRPDDAAGLPPGALPAGLAGFPVEVLARAQPRRAARGATVVSRWGGDRDFFVLLSGQVRVLVDGAVVRRLGPGEFFGEIAATDWGSGCGYVRTADVQAETDVELLVLPAEHLASAMEEHPPLRDLIMTARAERLGSM